MFEPFGAIIDAEIICNERGSKGYVARSPGLFEIACISVEYLFYWGVLRELQLMYTRHPTGLGLCRSMRMKVPRQRRRRFAIHRSTVAASRYGLQIVMPGHGNYV